ncbi:MAG: (Fe-S)-binding protein [Peptococcaceae bacterium]
MGELRKPIQIPVLLELIKDNILDYGNPLGLTGREINKWQNEPALPLTGEILFYTGGEYQLLPFLDSLTNAVGHFDIEGRFFSAALGVRNLINKIGVSAEKIYGKVMSSDEKRYQMIPHKAARILQGMGLEICSLAERELYSGALLYEFGYQAEFKTHAEKLIQLIKGTQAREIVCLSPHSAEMFKYHYPAIDPWCRKLKVYTFSEYLYGKGERLTIAGGLPQQKVTIHDSCRLVRELGFGAQIRVFLKNKFPDIEIIEAENSGSWTVCCGGPGKMMLPALANTIAKGRMNELEQTGAAEVLTFCPYCLAALEKGKDPVKSKIIISDIVEFLARGNGYA